MSDVEVRDYVDGDEDVVLALLGASLGWVPDDQSRAFFRWKHRQSPFGPSPAWVATVDGAIVGFRTFMRWDFVDGGRPLHAARAVDTATHPDHQGRGIFTTLTRHGLDELRAAGVELVFNTPNDQSLPGYLKMGWTVVGRLPVAVRPRSLLALARMVRARTPAEKWSVQTEVGTTVGELATLPVKSRSGLHTPRTLDFVRWRYGFAPLAYRAVADPTGAAVIVFRLRHRGDALEAALCEELGDARRCDELVGSMLRATGADYAIRIGAGRVRGRWLPLPRTGPILTYRDLGHPAPALDAWSLALGDVELF